jgi:hypothetical protein
MENRILLSAVTTISDWPIILNLSLRFSKAHSNGV